MKHNYLTVSAGDGILNIRVGAIIQRDGKVLMAANDRMDYYYSVGGRVRFGETAEEAVVREVLEETGTRMKVERLGFVHEDFFMGEEVHHGRPIHEIAFFYYMDVPADFDPVCHSIAVTGAREWLEWIDPATEPRKLFPEFFRTELQNPCETVKCIVSREWPDEENA